MIEMGKICEMGEKWVRILNTCNEAKHWRWAVWVIGYGVIGYEILTFDLMDALAKDAIMTVVTVAVSEVETIDKCLAFLFSQKNKQ